MVWFKWGSIENLGTQNSTKWQLLAMRGRLQLMETKVSFTHMWDKNI